MVFWKLIAALGPKTEGSEAVVDAELELAGDNGIGEVGCYCWSGGG